MTKEEKQRIIAKLKKKIITDDNDPLAMVLGAEVYNLGLKDAIKILRQA